MNSNTLITAAEQRDINTVAGTIKMDKLIFESNTHYAFVPALLPVRIHFNDVGKLMPLDDMTPKESVLLCMLLLSCIANNFMDYKTYIKEHKLERHFQK